jgi:hypothetical protein
VCILAINPWASFSYLSKTLLFNFTIYDKLGHYPHAWIFFCSAYRPGDFKNLQMRAYWLFNLSKSLTPFMRRFKSWRRGGRNRYKSLNNLRALENWACSDAHLWFENLYRQIKVNWINGWKDDGRLADYSHYLSLCCSTRFVDLADYTSSSRKDDNVAWCDGQSAKVRSTRIGSRI